MHSRSFRISSVTSQWSHRPRWSQHIAGAIECPGRRTLRSGALVMDPLPSVSLGLAQLV